MEFHCYFHLIPSLLGGPRLLTLQEKGLLARKLARSWMAFLQTSTDLSARRPTAKATTAWKRVRGRAYVEQKDRIRSRPTPSILPKMLVKYTLHELATHSKETFLRDVNSSRGLSVVVETYCSP